MRKSTVSDPGHLFFGSGNAKLAPDVATFTLPAGYTCPGACECQSRFDRKKRKVQDGKNTMYRCFMASREATYPTLRSSTDRNWKALIQAKTVEVMTALIDISLPRKFYTKVRVHVGGDFFSLDYFVAWMEVARSNPDRLFYAYTKSLHFWRDAMFLIPQNFVLTASRGGKFDHLIDELNLREAIVVYHPEEAEAMGLEIDHDDSLAQNPKVKKFALLIHGPGAAGSKHSKARQRLKREGAEFEYGKGKNAIK